MGYCENNNTRMKFWIIKCTAGWLETGTEQLSSKVVVPRLGTAEEQGERGLGAGAGSLVHQ